MGALKRKHIESFIEVFIIELIEIKKKKKKNEKNEWQLFCLTTCKTNVMTVKSVRHSGFEFVYSALRKPEKL